MCISNYSAQELSFDTKLTITTNDLIYHTNSVYLSKDSSITIQTDLISENCIAYYIENCQTKKLTKIQSSTKKQQLMQMDHTAFLVLHPKILLLI